MSSKRRADSPIDEENNKHMKAENDTTADSIGIKSEENGNADINSEVTNNGSYSQGASEEKKEVTSVGGTVLICGGTNWDLTGRKTAPKGAKCNVGRNLYTPHRFGPLSGVKVRLVATGSTAAHSVVITEEGVAMTFGRNEKGQLGHGDTTRRDIPTVVESIKNHHIIDAACGRNHTIFLTDRGSAFACGENKLGQCGIGNQHPLVPTATAVNYKGPVIVKVGCGAEFCMILDCKGVLHSFGCPEYGQLGHNTDGKYFITANKLGFQCETTPKRIVLYVEKAKDGHVIPVDVMEIVDFSCGSNHTVAIDSKKRVFSWGWGGLGRLGHAEQKDEHVPRLIKFFDSQSRGVKSVHCGSSYSLAINELGCVFLFGQTKRTGEANMYPKPIQDLTGWAVRSVGSGYTSIVMAADESVIAWGPSPTYGELGFGEHRKSCTTPSEVKALEGIYIKQVVVGMGHSIFIARDDTEQDRNKIAKLPEYTP